MNFKKIDNMYRPIPFWSWNEKLRTDETARQVRLMNEAGIGGYFMHARGGLLTEYMGEEWFDNVDAACKEGEKLGMRSWAYDENGWPSGFADGIILKMGEDYQLKTLVYKPTSEFSGDPAHVLLEKDGYTYYYDVNELYVDLLNPAVTEAFIKNVHEVYKEKCGDRIEGFFTDEPQLLRTPGFPYSVITFSEFEKRYGYDLRENIPALFFECEGYERVRFDFWKMTTDLFSKNFFKKIYDWCDENGYKLTGHLVCEEVLDDIVPTTGSDMAHYEYFHIPGIDWLSRELYKFLTANQLGSVSNQLGKKYVISESFALTGHNVSHAELKRIFEWQMVHGINLLCPHLEGYSNRGIRKRDYPVAMYYQEPWWDDVKVFFDTIARTGMMLGEGKAASDTLLIHSLSSAWVTYDGYVGDYRGSRMKMRKITDSLLSQIHELERKHILFDLGDETLIERHGRVEGGEFIIGNMRYKKVILPHDCYLFDNTKALLDKFISEGGIITTVEEIAPNSITEPNVLAYTMRNYPDYKLHYFVNHENVEVSAKITRGDLAVDLVTGETYPFSGEHTFGPYESLMLVETGNEREENIKTSDEKELSLLGEWEVKDATLNSITLDRCDYYFDGELVEKCGYVLNIIDRINEKKRPVELRQIYRFYVEEMPEGEIYLVTETPDLFNIKVNGKTLEKRDVGDFRDISFRRLPMGEHVKCGENVIEMTSTICQSEKVFAHLDNSWLFETMSNCLSYDVEIEPIYIAGDFGVELVKEDYEELPFGIYRVKERALSGDYTFKITRRPKQVDVSNLEESGYPEFAGTLTLKKRVNLADTHYRVKLFGRGMNSIHITVNGKYAGMRMFGPYDVSISDYLVEGENEIELKILNNLRNMQGPHHVRAGDSEWTGRCAFYKESNVFRHKNGADITCHDTHENWCEDISLAHFGLR